MPQYVIVTGPEFRRVEAALAKVDAAFPERFRDRIENLAEPLAAKARARVLALPTPGNAGHTGLRARVAEGVAVRVSGRAGVRITTSMSEPDERIIPRGLDRRSGWRHPLFGDRDRWFSNPGYSWFMDTMDDSQNEFENGLTELIEDSAREIADAGGFRP
ncbi:hypothetical protein C6N75_10000 [Streptomyces solincola]|uniref:HK97 gp10 family phage protein n=1 Tax=Streptomyces solincola TaxID=2100817 RepID=A0A2S9PY92_9ACTN|nr:hypothetical protein [Streptomyces solincola]PRH79406.1 hypothetical protein C6N75_10000 [Streptomyces solincola]